MVIVYVRHSFVDTARELILIERSRPEGTSSLHTLRNRLSENANSSKGLLISGRESRKSDKN